MKFKRVNVKSGAEYIVEFNTSHHWCFADPEVEPIKLLKRITDELILKWNNQQPETWQYSRV